MWKTCAVAFQNLSKCHWRSEALAKKEKNIFPWIDDKIKWPFLTQTGQELGQAKWQLFASSCLYHIGIICVLFTPWPIYRSTYRPIVGRYIDRCLTDMSVDISTDTRPIYWARYVSQHIGWYISRLSPNTWLISRLIYWSTCRPRYFGPDISRVAVDMSTDTSVSKV